MRRLLRWLRSSPGQTPPRVWEECSYCNDGDISCSGTGAAEPGERFVVSANGINYDVVVVAITTPGPHWEAIGRQSFDDRYRVDIRTPPV